MKTKRYRALAATALSSVAVALAGTACVGGEKSTVTNPPSARPVELDGAVPEAPTGPVPQFVFVGPGANGMMEGNYATNYELWTMNLDGTNKHRVTSDGKPKLLPKFSPDGTKLLYTKYTAGNPMGTGGTTATDVFVWNLSTNTEIQLTTGGISGYAMWSPDGSQIAFMKGIVASGTSPRTSVDGGIGVVLTASALWMMNANGSGQTQVAAPAGQANDLFWPGDSYWSQTNTILFNVIMDVGGCWKARTDAIFPNGTGRYTISPGGTACWTPSFDIPGDADPGWSPGGDKVFTSRGFSQAPANQSNPVTLRQLWAISADGADSESPLAGTQPFCNEGIPRASPDGAMVMVQRVCFAPGGGVSGTSGVYVTTLPGASDRIPIVQGGAGDWNPAFGPATQACVSVSGSYQAGIRVVANQNPAPSGTMTVRCQDMNTNVTYTQTFTGYPYSLIQDATTHGYLTANHPFSCSVQSGDNQSSFTIATPTCYAHP